LNWRRGKYTLYRSKDKWELPLRYVAAYAPISSQGLAPGKVEELTAYQMRAIT